MTDPAVGNDATERIIMQIIDREPSTLTLVRSDLKEAVMPLVPPLFPTDSALMRLTHLVEQHYLSVATVAGDEIGVELPTPTDPAPVGQRPVIYLDQKDWNTLANARFEPELVPVAERTAAERLIRLALDRRIVLPLSAAHMSETAKWLNQKRRQRLALTMLQLSCGWQMRDPLQIRRLELRQSFLRVFHGLDGNPPASFTLDPRAIHSGRAEKTLATVPQSGLDPELALSGMLMPYILGTIETMLDADPVDMGLNPGWVAKNQGFTVRLAGETSRPPTEKKASVEVFFLVDTQAEVADEASRARITAEQMRDWIMNHREDEIAAMPALGLFRETLYGKHLNGTTIWEDNDLTDLMYLTCGAARANYLVGERSLVSQIRQAQARLKRPQNAYRRIQDLMPTLEQHLTDAVADDSG